MTQLKIPNNSYNWLMVLVVIFPYLLIFQGLDFTDVGHSLTNYQQIFIEPASIQNSFACWLTNIIGGIWIKIIGDLGLFGAKLGGALVITLTCYLSYIILKDYIKKEYLLIGLLLTEMISFSGRVIIINYNNLTALFFTLSAYFLIMGIFKRQYLLFLFSGFLMGLNIFIRFPNILGILLVVVIFFYGYLKKIKISIQIRRSLYFFLGWCASIIMVIIIMKILGHYELYLNSLSGLFKMGTSSGSRHSGIMLIKLLIRDHLFVLQYFFIALVGTIAISKIFHKIKLNKYFKYIIFFIFALLISSFLYKGHRYFIYIIMGMLYLSLLINIFNLPKIDVNLKMISLTALLILFITPLGSNTGISNARFGMWLALPISIALLMQIMEIQNDLNFTTDSNKFFGRFKINKQEMLFAKIIILIFCFTFMLMFSFRYTYSDTTNRLAMHYSINHPKLKMVYTTKGRAKVVGELLDEIPKYVQAGDYLLCYEHIPMVHFLTETRPYLYKSWPMLYQPGEFQINLDKAFKEKEKYPVIVRAKRSTSNFEWPNNSDIGLINSFNYNGDREIMKEFIDKYFYKIVWENDFFQILLPGNNKY